MNRFMSIKTATIVNYSEGIQPVYTMRLEKVVTGSDGLIEKIASIDITETDIADLNYYTEKALGQITTLKTMWEHDQYNIMHGTELSFDAWRELKDQ